MSVVSKLQIVLEATTTAFDRGLRSATYSLQGFARNTQQMHDRMDRFVRQNQATFDTMQQIGMVAGVGLAVVGAGLKGAVDEAVKFESAMAGGKLSDYMIIDPNPMTAEERKAYELQKRREELQAQVEQTIAMFSALG